MVAPEDASPIVQLVMFGFANSGSNMVGHLQNNGTLLGLVPVGVTPIRVDIDWLGKVWACNQGSDDVRHINPASNSVDLMIPLSPGSDPYTYSDMTGSTLMAPSLTGTWTITHDSGVFCGKKWGYINWMASTPLDSKLTIQARSQFDGFNYSAWQPVTKLVDMMVPNGHYLQVRITFLLATTGESPILYDVSISPALWKRVWLMRGDTSWNKRGSNATQFKFI